MWIENQICTKRKIIEIDCSNKTLELLLEIRMKYAQIRRSTSPICDQYKSTSSTQCEDKSLQQTNKQNKTLTSLLSLSSSSRPPATVKTPSTLEPARGASLLGSLGPLLHEVALLLNKKVYLYIFFLYLQTFRIDVKWRLS